MTVICLVGKQLETVQKLARDYLVCFIRRPSHQKTAESYLESGLETNPKHQLRILQTADTYLETW